MIAVSCFAFTGHAQDKFSVGLKTGINSAKLNLSNIPSGQTIKSEAKSGGFFGCYAKLRLIGGLSFQPELLYSNKNAKITSIMPGSGMSNQKLNAKFHTWDVPLLLNLQLLDLKVLKVYGLAGPVASYVAKAKMSNFSLKDEDYSSANWTIQAGGGVELGRFTAEVRYEWGVKKVIKDRTNYTPGAKTDVLTFALGFRLFRI